MISNNLKKRIYTSLFLVFSVFLIYNFNIFLVYFLIVLSVLSIIEFIQLTRKTLLRNFFLITLNIFFIFYVFTFSFMFFLFSNLVGLKVVLYILLIGCIASDIGGFISGKIFKGPKLTKISPNKTYSGAVGSLILTLLIISFLYFYFIQIFSYKIVIVAIMTSLFCQLGDLMISFLKRKAKMKDTGNFLPGHGGVLDRLDGIFLGIPIGFITLIIIN